MKSDRALIAKLRGRLAYAKKTLAKTRAELSQTHAQLINAKYALSRIEEIRNEQGRDIVTA